MNRFIRIGLPIILVIVAIVVILFVINSFQAMEHMKTTGKAGSTLLNK